MKKEEKTLGESFGIFCYNMLLLFFAVLISGFIFMKLWAWLIVPILVIQPVSFAQSIAITIFLSYVLLTPRQKDQVDTLELSKLFLKSTAIRLFILFIGYLAHLFLW